MRLERDALGEREVPDQVYYGIHTVRNIENFPISGVKAHPKLVWATVLIKKAAAETHLALKLLPEKLGRAIVQACAEIVEGKFRDQFVIDVFQMGAGTSHNMNANEVIANRAIELLGGKRGDYTLVHPNDHVNMSQSTNDVFPASLRLAALTMIDQLLPVIGDLRDAFREKGLEFNGIWKSGRTHLQDAVPMRLGQEFEAYAAAMGACMGRIDNTARELRELNLGATAIGAGTNTHPRYRELVIQQLQRSTGWDLRPADNLFEMTQNADDFVQISSALRTLALNLIRIANDLRLLASGPRTGLDEITLPAVSPGSSIMPGKVNPSIPEMVDMVGFYVVGLDHTVSMACQAGQMELNVMLPVVNYALLQMFEVLQNAIHVFSHKCVRGIQGHQDRCQHYAETTPSLATLLNPFIGYAAASQLVKDAMASGKTILQLVRERQLLTEEQIRALFPLDHPPKSNE